MIPMETDKDFLRQDSDYRTLKAFRKAECIYDVTYYFAHRFLNKGDRMIDQMVQAARNNAVRSVDFCRVQMYWNLGKPIFEEEQQGKECTDYGTYLIRNLAKRLESEYGSGFWVRQLEQSRQFYRLYPIANTLRSQLYIYIGSAKNKKINFAKEIWKRKVK